MENKEVLQTVYEYLYNLKDGIKNIAYLIDGGNEEETFNIIAQVAEGLQWIDEAMNATKQFHKNKLNLQEINDFIGEISEALENEDYILVSDLFTYEITPLIDKLHINIKEFI